MLINNRFIPVLGFAGFSGSGKTTLLEQIIPILKQSGLRIGLLKHSHHNIEPDSPGKDSFRLRYAGADQLLLATSARHMLFFEYHDVQHREPTLQECLAQLTLSQLDIVLVEGFRDATLTKIEVHRPVHGKPLLYPRDENIIAIATDCEDEFKKLNTLKTLNLNHHDEVAEFIKHWLNTASDTQKHLGYEKVANEQF